MIYETTDIKLGAVILCEIPEAYFVGVDEERVINSKKVIKISYPEQYEEEVKKLNEDYSKKIQVVNVYHYNKSLCLIRDNLFRGERRRGKEAGGARI